MIFVLVHGRIAPIVGLDYATLDARTQGNLRLETIVDPLIIFMPASQYVDHGAYMSGYINRTALRVVSIGGDPTLVDRENAADFIFRDGSE